MAEPACPVQRWPQHGQGQGFRSVMQTNMTSLTETRARRRCCCARKWTSAACRPSRGALYGACIPRRRRWRQLGLPPPQPGGTAAARPPPLPPFSTADSAGQAGRPPPSCLRVGAGEPDGCWAGRPHHHKEQVLRGWPSRRAEAEETYTDTYGDQVLIWLREDVLVKSIALLTGGPGRVGVARRCGRAVGGGSGGGGGGNPSPSEGGTTHRHGSFVTGYGRSTHTDTD
ncbi:hypothetical protein GWK47_001264 [Chionoecetes opilio]|uniref:Uncharacterized protein n=1 Tax=Chionoecetes opilio TaxID=41210 RepID=A0A8J4Y2S1_CHIOP|nr:hypothetical protein GWK47_001264 [Chionoecetes opilio]